MGINVEGKRIGVGNLRLFGSDSDLLLDRAQRIDKGRHIGHFSIFTPHTKEHEIKKRQAVRISLEKELGSEAATFCLL